MKIEPFSDTKIYTVSELNNIVNDTLGEFAVRVRGEVSDFKRSQNGKFLYFDLKDDASRINCFAMAFQLHQELEDGMEVVVTGSPGLYVPYGKYTFRVRMVELVGEGALRRAFELTKQKLEVEGLFAEDRKKPLPRFPQRIVIVTSREAAAYTDVLRILKNRWQGLEILLYNVHVQGADAAGEIVEALTYFNKHAPVDILILTRGGGSLEDLQAFNTENVCRAVFASRIPVISAVGHERDVTLCDLVADRRASTPSNAAEIAVPDVAEILFALDSFASMLKSALEQSVQGMRARLEALTERMEGSLQKKLEQGRALEERLGQAIERVFVQSQGKLNHISVLLRTLNPQAILQRGYSITMKNGRVVKSALVLQVGDKVETRLASGKFFSTVRKQ